MKLWTNFLHWLHEPTEGLTTGEVIRALLGGIVGLIVLYAFIAGLSLASVAVFGPEVLR